MRERERERERDRGREGDRGRERGREREGGGGREREVGWGGIVLTWELIITAHSISLWLFAYQF